MLPRNDRGHRICGISSLGFNTQVVKSILKPGDQGRPTSAPSVGSQVICSPPVRWHRSDSTRPPRRTRPASFRHTLTQETSCHGNVVTSASRMAQSPKCQTRAIISLQFVDRLLNIINLEHFSQMHLLLSLISSHFLSNI